MTPTKELCDRLDELGVEYDAASYDNAVFWGNAEYELCGDGNTRLIVGDATPEQAINATVGPKITEDTSDGWHSFKDLYHHRALLFSVIVHNYKDMCWKSKKHDDGTELDWNFIVGIDTPWGQASYHYGMEYWDMFDCKVLERAPKYDGYTPEQSVERIARLVELDAATVGKDIEHYDGSGRRGTVAILQGGRKPDEVLFVQEDGVTHYLPEGAETGKGEIDTDYFDCKLTTFKCHSCGWSGVVDDGYAGYSFEDTDMPRNCPNCGRKVVSE